MSQINKTLAFVMCAVCSIGAAALTHYSFKPAAPKEAADVGEPFYPDFNDPSKATSLRVAAHNDKTSRTDVFAVEFKDGRWRIPSHHNYPADGKTRLAQTAASMLGIRRGQLVSSSDDALKNYGLLDPLDKNIPGTDGRGNRVTLADGDTVLADYIIGRREGEGNQYYIRRADEPRVYLAEVNIDLSTKFVDWIQPNLLDATDDNFRTLELDRYEVDEAKGVVVPGEISRLTRKSSTDEWKLDGIDESKSKVKTTVVKAMTKSLADMKIVGVRPKPAGLKAALKGEKGRGPNPLEEADMQQKGYFLTPDGALYSNEGEFIAGTADGVAYRLRFGEVFTGSEMDIEIGSPAKAEDADKPAEASKDEAGKDKPDETRKENRYVFITAEFDAKLLGDAPVEPVKPVAPDGYTPTKPAAATVTPTPDPKPENPPADAASDPATSALPGDDGAVSLAGPPSDPPTGESSPAATEAPPAEAAASDAPSQTPAEESGETPAAETPAADAAADKPSVTPAAPKDPNAEYEAALKAYEQAFDEYRVQKQDYDGNVKKGQERAKQLSDRFADWYYVISAELYNDLKVSPDQLIEPKDPATTAADENAATPPGGGDAPAVEESPAASTPAAEGNESPAAPAVETKSEAPPVEEPKSEAPPPAEEPKSDPPPAEPAQPEASPEGEAAPPQS